jgi:hypothetical protein
MGVASINIKTTSVQRIGNLNRECCKGDYNTSKSVLDVSYIEFLSLLNTKTSVTLVHSKSTCCIVNNFNVCHPIMCNTNVTEVKTTVQHKSFSIYI